MFPTVIHSKSNGCSSSSSVLSSFVTGASHLLVPGRVTAVRNIPQGVFSSVIDPDSIVEQPDVQQLSVDVNPGNILDLDEKSRNVWLRNIHWSRALRLSDDCHSYNIQLKFHPACQSHMKTVQNPQLVLQVIKPIDAGQELLLWFSEDILAMLQVAFLTPANIQGQKKYVCNRCLVMYESPNPLKLHITLGCGKYGISVLWKKLSELLKNNLITNMKQQETFSFKLSPEPQVFRQKNAIDLTIPSTTRVNEVNLYRPYREPSAFKPFKKELSDSPPLQRMLPINFEPEVHFHSPPYNDEAQIESLVSNLGKSRQGHICLYCGKCYSRKYGLKIHIRTHTGYKPLKCKFCSRPFGDPSNLNKHVRLHAEGETPYKCDLCGKILVRRRDLKRHLKSRHMVEMHPSLDVLQKSPKAEPEGSDEEMKHESS